MPKAQPEMYISYHGQGSDAPVAIYERRRLELGYSETIEKDKFDEDYNNDD